MRLPARRHLVSFALLLVAGLATVALLTKDQWDWLLEDGGVQSEGVTAPTIDDVDTATERLYRIGDGSSVSYAVEERLAGSTSTARGATPAVAGDIAVDMVDPAASRVGTIVVNVEMFESDSNLRDRRIRHDFLESTHFPYAEFTPTAIDGLPAAVADGTSHELTISGDLLVKETTAPATFAGSVTITPDELRATLASTVLMSDFDVGPIDIAGLVHTSDEVELELHLVATRVDPDSTPDAPDEFVADDGTPPGGAFAGTVMPILEQRCAGCHNETGPGWNTVALDTAGDAAAIAADIALVTAAGYMPPWPANDAGLEFRHDGSLTDEELAAIAEWAADGGGLDVAPDTPLVAGAEQLRAIERDVVVPGEPYAGDPEQPDDYRCQAYEVGDPDTERWIRAVSFEPDQTEVVHHAVLSVASASQRESAIAEAGADGKPGWECYGPTGVEDTTQFWAWAPGTPPYELPAGAGVRLAPGEFVVIQIHYHYDHEAPLDASALIVDLASDDELTGGLVPVQSALYLAPAELPCTAEQSGPLCERATVITQLLDDYGIFGATIADGLLLRCGLALDDYLADTDGVTTSHCDRRVANPGRVVKLWPHMHEFGASYRMILNPDTPDEQLLLEIPAWSFEWQMDYLPANHLVLEPDDVIRVECTYDRSLVHQEEPRYVTWGVGTGDEMCYTSIATMPVGN